MFEKTTALWDKPKILWTLQDKFDFLYETWWVIILAVIILILIIITIQIILIPIINKIFDWLEKNDLL